MATTPPESPSGFEAAMDALEQIVVRMETGDLSLEDSLLEYQRGMELVENCQAALDEAQRRLETLSTPSSALSQADSNDATKVPDILRPDDAPF